MLSVREAEVDSENAIRAGFKSFIFTYNNVYSVIFNWISSTEVSLKKICSYVSPQLAEMPLSGGTALPERHSSPTCQAQGIEV